MIKIVFRNLTTLSILFLAPFQLVYSYEYLECGQLGYSGVFNPEWDTNDTVYLQVLKADFDEDQYEVIVDAVNSYAKSNIGNTSLDIVFQEVDPATELAMELLNNDPTISIRAKDAIKFSIFNEDENHTIYQRSNITPLGIAFPGEADVADNETFAWVQNKLESGIECVNANGNLIVDYTWHDGRDIIVHRKKQEGFPEGLDYYNLSGTTQVWADPNSNITEIDLNYVMVHEIGHFAGLAHTDGDAEFLPPNVMITGYSRIGGSPSNFNYELDTFGSPTTGRREAQPLGDDLKGIRNRFPGNVSVVDAAVNQWEYGDEWDYWEGVTGVSYVRQQSLWKKSWLGDQVAYDGISAGGDWAGFTPISMHNLGTVGKHISGRVQLVPILYPADIWSSYKTFGAWVNPGAYTQQTRDLWATGFLTFNGEYRIRTTLDSQHVYDNNPHNSGDLSENTWLID